MQKYLNNIVIDIYEICNKYWIIPVILVVYILASVILCIFGFLCIMNDICPGINKYLLLEVGFGSGLIVFIYIVIPCGLRCILNCLWYKQYKKHMLEGSIISV